MKVRSLLIAISAVLALGGCSSGPESAPAVGGGSRPSILFVTLDTTRADAIGPDAAGVQTPSFNALAARGRLFRQAYTTVPETLPSHTSMMTGLYPAGHGIHENARYLSAKFPVVAEKLHQAGYRTVAFVSSFTLARRFGLARGFNEYDDHLAQGRSERTSRETTDAVLAELGRRSAQPRFLWVHYYDPHYPYTPPEPFRSQYAARPYLGEIAAMDEQLGRLIQAFEQHVEGSRAVVVAGDHGEGLGDHGESQHGNLLYQATVRVPLVLAGPRVKGGLSDTPVSTRRIFHTLLDWAGVDSAHSLLGTEEDVVLGEAMKPFLEFGWQPQVMTVAGRHKAILAGTLETYDVVGDPAEARNLGAGTNLPSQARAALEEYPIPPPESARTPDNLDEEAKRRLASLGYVGAGAAPIVRKEAPRPADMTGLFDTIETASGLFANEQYARAIPLLQQILVRDPHNLDATLRLATAHSVLGHEDQAMAAFRKAADIAPRSEDVRTYLALHYARGKQWEEAVPLLEQIVLENPDRLPAVEALAAIRERQGQLADAVRLRQKIFSMRSPSAEELVQLGQMAMSVGQTPVAIEAFANARTRQGSAFAHDLELGVLYLAERRYEDARSALDRVAPSHPEYPMALFKRAQVSVLLGEPDRAARIQLAREKATATTRELIARERLFK